MDRLVYTTMAGAKHVMDRQATTSNNLANATTTGFRSQIDAFQAVPVVGEGNATRTSVIHATVGANFTPGAMQQTGRDLDVAVQGDGWIAVQTASGEEAYTRNGSLKISENGILQTQNGSSVLGDGGVLSIPPDVKIAIAKDGTITAQSQNGKSEVTVVGRIKLVNPPSSDMVRRDDGFFATKPGAEAAEVDSSVTISSGFLEGSNVNVVEEMVSMISLARQFEMQMKMLQNAEQNDAKASQILAHG